MTTPFDINKYIRLEYWPYYVGAIALITVSCILLATHKKRKLHRIALHAETWTVDEFLEWKRCNFRVDCPGCYILYNKKRRIYYVGQSIHIGSRVFAHFTGHGNGHVFADYQKGHEFRIKLIPLAKSGYRALNPMEKELIRYYHAFTHGYNKTRGNS